MVKPNGYRFKFNKVLSQTNIRGPISSVLAVKYGKFIEIEALTVSNRKFISKNFQIYLNLIHFRSDNHRLPIETGRWNNVELEDRKWNLCDMNTIGDEFHCLIECPFFTDERKKYIAQ